MATHCADHSEAISRMTNIEVRDKDIKFVPSYQAQGFRYGCGRSDFEAIGLQERRKSQPDTVFVINKQNLRLIAHRGFTQLFASSLRTVSGLVPPGTRFVHLFRCYCAGVPSRNRLTLALVQNRRHAREESDIGFDYYQLVAGEIHRRSVQNICSPKLCYLRQL